MSYLNLFPERSTRSSEVAEVREGFLEPAAPIPVFP